MAEYQVEAGNAGKGFLSFIMATRCIVIGEEEVKKIEFKYYLDSTGVITQVAAPKTFENIELVCNNYDNSNYDLMFAYDKKRSDGFLYLGHWNGGTV